MDVRLSSEQRALADAAARVIENSGPHAVGALDDVERRAQLDAAVIATGWLDLRTPDDGGAPWASGVEVAIVAEALGRGAADTAFIGPTLAADLRRRAGAPTAPTAETVVLTPGLGSLAIAAADGTLPAGAVAVDVPAGSATALCLVRSGDGWTLGTVTVERPMTTTDLTRRVAGVASGSVVTPIAEGAALSSDDLAAWRALGLAASCADLVGTMDGAVALSAAYAIDRSQYGRQIGSFQAVQHLLADALVLSEGSRSVARHAAWAIDALAPRDALHAAAIATAYCARSARTVCETAIQVHGGIGNTWECMAHVHLRRALLSSDLLGGVQAALELVVEQGTER